MKNALKLASIVPFCLAVAACGGGGGAGSAAQPVAGASAPRQPSDPGKTEPGQTEPGKTEPGATTPGKEEGGASGQSKPAEASPNRNAAGIWFGQDRVNKAAFALVAVDARHPEQSEYFILDAGDAGNYSAVYTGWMEYKNHELSSFASINPEMGAPDKLNFGADPANTLRSTVYDSTGNARNDYLMAYAAQNLTSSAFTQLTGQYGSLHLDAQGKLSGQIERCDVTGQLTLLEPGKNMYRIALDVTPQAGARCGTGLRTGQPFAVQGLAALAALPGEAAPSLLLGAADKDKGLRMLGGAFRQQ